MDITYTIMIPLLEVFSRACHSYGWGILLLTLLVRILVWPLVNSSTRSMQGMSQLQPKIKAIQERYKENPEVLQRKLMEFYQKNKINPMGGCLPTLVQLPVLFALFATFTGPPFGDKLIPVKVNLISPDKEAGVHLNVSPTSGSNSPYVSKDGKMAKVVVKPGDEVMIFGKDDQGRVTGQAKKVDYRVFAVEGVLPADFKPGWSVGNDPNGATIDLYSGSASFPRQGDIEITAELPDKARIAVPVKVIAAPKEGQPAIGWFGEKGTFKERTDSSTQVAEINVDGRLKKLVVSPGSCTVKAGTRDVHFEVRTLDGTALPEAVKPIWHVTKDLNAATIDKEGHAVFPCPGEVVINAVIPGEAKDESFYFISSVGKIAKGWDLFQPANWDVLSMILAFAITMVISQKLMMPPQGPGADPEQAAIQKQTQQTMPIAITAMFFFIPLPAGVYIYMVVSNVVQSLQTWLIMRTPARALVDVTDEVSSAPVPRSPIPPKDAKMTPAEDKERGASQGGEKAVKLSGSRKKSRKKK